MKLKLNLPPPNQNTSSAAVTTNPALKQIFQRLSAAGTPLAKAA